MKTKAIPKYPLWIQRDKRISDWGTDKFPGAIRLCRDLPPFAFGECVAIVHPTCADFAEELVSAYNASLAKRKKNKR